LPLQLFLVRHPVPVAADGLCYGRLEVAVENQTTIAAARSVRKAIPARALAEAQICSSPSLRCLGLARLIATPQEPTTHEDLTEMNFGDWQGRGWDEIPREQLDAWAADLWNYRPGGGESAAMVAVRWERWITRMRQSDPRCLIAVTHAGVIRVALSRCGKTPDATVVAMTVPFGSVHQVTLD